MKWIMQGKRMEQENPIFPEGKKKIEKYQKPHWNLSVR